LASLFSVAALGQQAYTWTDENGTVHYSDRPFPGAATIDLRAAQGFTAPQPTQPVPAITDAAPAEEEELVRAYTAFEVIQPVQQETLWNIGTVLNVTVDLQPDLQPGHHLGAYLDGQLIDVGATTRTARRCCAHWPRASWSSRPPFSIRTIPTPPRAP
jgi:hypothetical protein